MASSFVELTGTMIGNWLIVGQSFFKGHRRYHYCECQLCKVVYERRLDSLLKGGTSACTKCTTTRRNIDSATHKESKTRLYKQWAGMKARVKDVDKNYLSLGITVCDEWHHSYEAFRDWALLNGYTNTLTIERIDPQGNYEPNNCTFITNKEQQANKLNTIRLSDGSMAWNIAQSNGITRAAFDKRLRMGWDIEKICTTPLRKNLAGLTQQL